MPKSKLQLKIQKYLLIFWFIVFPLGQLGKFEIHGEINVHLIDILTGMIIVWWGIGRVREIGTIETIRNIWQDKISKGIVIWAATALFSLLINIPRLSFQELTVSSLYWLRWLTYAGLYFAAKDFHSNGKNFIVNGLIFSGIVTAIVGLSQYFFYPDIRPLENLGWDPHYYRVVGTFLDPAFIGIILVLTMVLLINTRKGPTFFLKKVGPSTVFFVIIYLSFALTYSRSSYLAYLGVIIIFAWLKKSFKFWLAFTTLFLITVFILPRPGGEGVKLERQASVWARINNWQQSLTIWEDYPVFGVGFNTYRYAQRDYGFIGKDDWQKTHSGGGADSSLLFILAATGIVGLGAYLWMGIQIFNYSIVAKTSIIALLIHSWFSNSLFYPWIMGWMWLLIGSMENK